jgi:hypothetical protein
METVVGIQAKFANDEFEFSRHAVDQTILRVISVQEVCEAIRTAELLEDYPNDKYERCQIISPANGLLSRLSPTRY